MYYNLISLQKLQKTMQKEVEKLYRSKLQNIEQKFHIITEAYSKLLVEIDKKNQTINDLTQIINVLEINLEQRNTKLEETKVEIQNLRLQLEKEMMIKKAYMATHNKTNSLVPIVNSSKISSGILDINSQSSILPKPLFQKESSQKSQSVKIKQKYENLLKSLSPSSKSSKSRDLNTKYVKRNNEKQILSKTEPKKLDFDLQSAKAYDLSNQNIIKSINEVRQSQNNKLQTHPITHGQTAVGSLSQMVNKQNTMQTLTKIWQERDREIEKMDQLFQSINTKLKQFEQ